MNEKEYLTREDALILLGELEHALTDLPSGDLDEEEREEVQRLVRGLRRLPVPDDVLQDRTKEIRAWTELLLEGKTEEARAGVGSVATFLEDHLLSLREIVESNGQS